MIAPLPSLGLSGRTVLVTGASGGLGARFAERCAAAGAAVALTARRTDRLVEVAAAIEAAGGRGVAVGMDVADEASVAAGFAAAESALGPIDSVIANAGLNVRGTALELTGADFDTVMGVNARGAFLTACEAARRMIAAGSAERGRIVMVASIGATKVLPWSTVYCASKAAMLMLGRSLAREWANQGINVNILCPGYVDTDINAGWLESDFGRKYVARFPRRRLLEAGELDALMLYLLSDASAGVTGASFTVDDGQSL